MRSFSVTSTNIAISDISIICCFISLTFTLYLKRSFFYNHLPERPRLHVSTLVVEQAVDVGDVGDDLRVMSLVVDVGT